LLKLLIAPRKCRRVNALDSNANDTPNGLLNNGAFTLSNHLNIFKSCKGAISQLPRSFFLTNYRKRADFDFFSSQGLISLPALTLTITNEWLTGN